ncbi:probable dolichyl pyrophosphate Man9GlcNAc2 alpha-1,3-glucosyltransferase [Juglans microcarpa x Juglans regia]|uniref:probable dolichyl pyrophosphate Man9GlcNAc2 alpha-1,3-glucosyltransferase n=1 Tax=Juglans microcarpa x Juglans regia TaxID=2249226 RepID=UPI001B7DBD03|nr:probable dolichyl pyrophosphate Man9GlcNAc2 alpha-1,3-glucosyltransferase [Juglans microcarpa x Juglans regia]
MEKRRGRKVMKDKEEVVDDDPRWWLVHKGIAASFLYISMFALLVRVAVSLHPYSGAGNPPKYGDFEAQRHWMDITLNMPVEEWYRNSTTNDLSYWGLDYPPLTAYQSYVHGLFIRLFHPEAVSLFTSRGHESYLGKLLMRWTVLSSDALVFFPAVFYFVFVYYSGRPHGQKTDIAWHIAIMLLSPCLILIDHGHFQYNCISLGLTVGAVAAVHSNKELVAYFLFGLALNHKQVLRRLAPFERGIYEDYVANFWYTTSVFIKWKRMFTTQSLKLLSLGATVSTCLPSMLQLNSAFSFYMFSFQVHEKSILLPLLPASLLALEEPFLLKWITLHALFSMFPLLRRDGLILPYIALSILFTLIYHAPSGRRQDRKETPSFNSFVTTIIVLCSVVLHIVYLTMQPPRRYPFLFEAVIMLLCFSQFMVLCFYTNAKQWMLKRSVFMDKEKKLL